MKITKNQIRQVLSRMAQHGKRYYVDVHNNIGPVKVHYVYEHKCFGLFGFDNQGWGETNTQADAVRLVARAIRMIEAGLPNTPEAEASLNPHGKAKP